MFALPRAHLLSYDWLTMATPIRRPALFLVLCKFTLTMVMGQATTPAQANVDLGVFPSEIVESESHWRFFENTTQQSELRVQRRALTDQGALQIGKQQFSYNKDLEQLDLLEAYTLKASGQKIEVLPQNIQVQSGIVESGNGHSWPGVEVRQVAFPDVQKGDSVVWRYRRTTHQPALSGWASEFAFAYPWESVHRQVITIEAPQDLKLNVFAEHFQSQKTVVGGQDVWRIEGSHAAYPLEHNSANSLTWLPRVYASTLPSHEVWAERFSEKAMAKALVTPAIAQLAREVAQGLSSDKDKAQAAYDWIRKNLRYVAVYMGVGGYVPNDVENILRNRYGDCKDHVLLMIALLKAMGIEAVPALMNTTPEYALPELPVGFNHVIVYLPTLQQFADPTAATVPFGKLPWEVADKPTAVVLASGASRLHTPAFNAQDNRLIVKSIWSLAKTGVARASVEVNSYGNAAKLLQDQLMQIPLGMGSVAVQRVLAGSRLTGRGFITYPPVQRDTQAQSMKIELENVGQLLSDPLAGSVPPHPRLSLPLYILDNMGDFSAETRRNAMTCTPVQLREEFELAFDPVFKILRAPQDLSVTDSTGVSFEAKYRVEGNRIIGWQELVFSPRSHHCSTSEYTQRREVMQRIAQHLRSAVLYAQ